MAEFKAWPKTPRLFRDITVTEKIDGTNAAIIVSDPFAFGTHIEGHPEGTRLAFGPDDEGGTPDLEYLVSAQSRKRLVTPGKQTDNYGFAGWVYDNANALAQLLGPGYHYGEWWGNGINRGYDQTEKHFSLFNTHRYAGIKEASMGLLDVVPVLYQGPFSEEAIRDALYELDGWGSAVAPEFSNPEGVIVYHSASSQVYKVLIEHDELPKGLVPYSEKVLAESAGRSDWREEGAYL